MAFILHAGVKRPRENVGTSRWLYCTTPASPTTEPDGWRHVPIKNKERARTQWWDSGHPQFPKVIVRDRPHSAIHERVAGIEQLRPPRHPWSDRRTSFAKGLQCTNEGQAW